MKTPRFPIAFLTALALAWGTAAHAGSFGGAGLNAENPFGATADCPKDAVAAGAATELVVNYSIFSHDYFIYRHMSAVRVDEASGLTAADAIFPKGKVKLDPVSGEQKEIFEYNFKVRVPVTVPADATAGAHKVAFNAKWQGCNKPDNYCLFPANEDFVCDVKVAGSAAVAPTETVESDVLAEAEVEDANEVEDDSEVDNEVEDDSEVDNEVEDDSEAENEADSNDGVVSVLPPPTRTLGASTPASESCAGEAESTTGLIASVTSWLESKLEGAQTKGTGPGLFFLLLVFAGGLASSLTPCVYPMIPITVSVIGASADKGRLKAFTLACVYVAGIAATYTILGLVAARSSDGMFGQMLQNPWVLIGVAGVMLALAASMFGFFELALPSSVTTKASMVGGGGYVGAFIVGTVAGVVAAPCTGPIVILLLGVITANPAWGIGDGALVMLTYSLGLGMLFLGVGTFAGILSSMPRSGTWMVTVKHVFGVVLIAATVFYLGQAVDVAWAAVDAASAWPEYAISAGWMSYLGQTVEVTWAVVDPTPAWAEYAITAGWVVVVLLAAWIIAGAKDIGGPNARPRRIAAGAVAAAIGLFVILGPDSDYEGVVWGSEYQAGLDEAKASGKPVILDFTADWCGACKELEHKTYTDPAVMQCSGEFETIMIDATTDTPEFVVLQDQYGIKGLPKVYFICPDGDVITELTLKGFEAADSFLDKMNVALNTCRSGGETS